MHYESKSFVVDGQTAFIAHPELRGLWLRVHPCILFIACPACGAPSGSRCWGARSEPITGTHYDRRGRVWRRYKEENGMKWGKGGAERKHVIWMVRT